jgi:hypothetical protein
VAITHKDVGCVIAGEYPRFEACFTPTASVGRAQVQFRADETGPWYGVTMTPSGACHVALLPKPKKGIGSFKYFIEVVDRQFSAVQQPETAPSRSYAPVVVDRATECDRRMVMAASQPTGQVVLSVVRDAGGKVIQAAASAAGQPVPAGVAGFSADGVTFAGATPGAGSASSSSGGSGSTAAAGAGAGAAAGGIGITTIAIAGGAVAAAGLVAVAASGGGDEGTPTPAQTSLSGRWSGSAAQGAGLSLVSSFQGVSCTGSWDLTVDFVQSGTTLNGSGTSVSRTFNCSLDIPGGIPGVSGQTGSGTLSGTASGGALTFRIGELTFTGTYTNSRMEARSNTTIEGVSLNYTMILTR